MSTEPVVPDRLRGPRVHLRPPRAADAEAFAAAVRRSRRTFRGYIHPPSTAERFRAWLREGRDDPTRVRRLVVRTEDGVIVGLMNVNSIQRGMTQSATIGYAAFAPHEGRGYMGEALDLVLRLAFRHLRLHRIEAGIQPGNERSIRLVERAGFRYEGTARALVRIGGRWRDHERWAIVRDEWIARRRAARGKAGAA